MSPCAPLLSLLPSQTNFFGDEMMVDDKSVKTDCDICEQDSKHNYI